MKTVVLDDDPTGTQAATGVRVLFQHDVDQIADVLAQSDSVYLQTNTRAVDESHAIALMRVIRRNVEIVEERLQDRIRIVLRGDSTLRGHVFPETATMLREADVILFAPAFPAGGRVTVNGTHLIRTRDGDQPVSESEYAADPVFPFTSSHLVDYVEEKSGRRAVSVPLRDIHTSGMLAYALQTSEPGSVIVPDAETDDDIRLIVDEVELAERRGAHIVVRCASPLAAALAGVQSNGLLPAPPRESIGGRVLVVCGSHTLGATRQLKALAQKYGDPALLDVDSALVDPRRTGLEAAERLREQLGKRGVAILASQRDRSLSHGTLRHGELVMESLTSAVRELRLDVDIVISKGGITSSEVARIGLGAKEAIVHGQILPGISEWGISVNDKLSTYVVVPGNVGDDDVLRAAVDRYRTYPADNRR